MSQEIILGRITEEDLHGFYDGFREEIANTIALVEELGKAIFGSEKSEDLTPGEVYTFLMCEFNKIETIEDEGEANLAALRLRRAISVFSIVFGVDVPKVLLGMDRNVYDTVQAMLIIEKNGKELQQLEKAKAELDQVIAIEAPTTVQ